MGRVTVFSITSCPHCRAAKTLLSEKGVEYVEINLDQFPSRRSEMIQRSNGKKTVPQIFFNNQHIGGNDSLQALNNDGKLDDMLKQVLESTTPDDVFIPPSEHEILEAEELANAASLEDEKESASLLQGVERGSDEEKTLTELIHQMRSREGGLEIIARWHYIFRYHACFIGQDAVDWMLSNKFASSREEAVKLGERLVELNVIHHFTNDHGFKDAHLYYRFSQDDDPYILNTSQYSSSEVTANTNQGEVQQSKRSAVDVANSLRKKIMDIYNKFLEPDGSKLDYKGVSASEEYTKFVLSTSELVHVDLSELSTTEKKSLFINLYNAMVIHGTIVLGNPQTNLQRVAFFTRTSYIVGGLRLTLNGVEHGILRGNKKPPGPLPGVMYKSTDPRSFLALPGPADERIHTALNCGAKSCPPVKLFSAEKLDEELTLAAEAFFEDPSSLTVDPENNSVKLTKICDWYASDFGKNDREVLETIMKYTSGEKKEQLEKVLKSGKNIHVSYFPYDWGANSKD